MSENQIIPAGGDFLLYTNEDGAVKVGVVVQGETVWLTQKAMGELFGVNVPAVSKHLANIYLSEAHIHELNRIVSTFLDLADYPHPGGPRQSQRAGNPPESRTGIRRLPPDPGPGLPVGFR